MNASVWTRTTRLVSLSALLWSGHGQAQTFDTPLPVPDPAAITMVDPVYPAPWDVSITAVPIIQPVAATNPHRPLAEALKVLLQPASHGVSAVDTTDNASRRRRYNHRLQTRDLLAVRTRSIRIDSGGDQVLDAGFSHI